MAYSRIIGAMSGTSADGVDVAITQIHGRGLSMRATLLRHHHQPYEGRVRDTIFALRNGQVAGTEVLKILAMLARDVSLAYAVAIKEALMAEKIDARDIAAVAAHGQTLFHDPPMTMQWLDPALLAAETGCAVVSDFRRADCAAGGQGAPLVPFADYLLFRDKVHGRALLNLGGIANVTYLRAGGSIDEVVAFDTGPGNCVSDDLVRRATGGAQAFDAGGALALRGTPNEAHVARAMTDPYFQKPAPKSTDVPEMLAAFAGSAMGNAPLESALATAVLFSARSIALALRQWPNVDELIVSGGGTDNAALMSCLRRETGIPLRTTDDFGIPSAAKEAMAFALLGAATLDGEPSNVPSVTGARRRVVLGSITPRP